MVARTARGQLQARATVAGENEAMQRLSSRADLARWVGLRQDVEQAFADTDQLNLDRKQALLGAFFAIEGLTG
jgi:DNA polymerase III subunit delta'